MTYCLGIMTREGLVMASDSRSNAGYDQVNVCRKMHTFVEPRRTRLHPADQRQPLVLAVGHHAAPARLRPGTGPGRRRRPSTTPPASSASRSAASRTSTARPSSRTSYKFNVHLLLAGQIRGQPHDLYLIYPQGNPLRATEDSPYLQIGECKYGRPILDRGVRYDRTTLDDAARYALISLDSTMRSNVTVGPPIDLLVYARDELRHHAPAALHRQGPRPPRDPFPVGAGPPQGGPGAAARPVRGSARGLGSVSA